MIEHIPEALQYSGGMGAGILLFAIAFERIYRVVRPASPDDEATTTLQAIQKLCGAVEKLDSSVTELRIEVAKLSGRLE